MVVAACEATTRPLALEVPPRTVVPEKAVALILSPDCWVSNFRDLTSVSNVNSPPVTLLPSLNMC